MSKQMPTRWIALSALMALWPLTATAQPEAGEKPGVLIQAGVQYQYGDDEQGDMDLDSKIGMVAPDLRVWFPGRSLGVGLRYLSGDFDGSETVAIPDGGIVTSAADYGSRKELTLGQSREDIQLQALYRPRPWVTITAGYRYLEFQMSAMLDLVSDVRRYGGGTETYDSTARGPFFGLELDLPLHSRWSMHLAGQALPWMDTQIRSSYSYSLLLEDRKLAEEWFENGSARAFGGEAALQFLFPGDRVALRMGYVFEKAESREDVERTWVDTMLGNEPRDWRTDRYQGFTASSIFQF